MLEEYIEKLKPEIFKLFKDDGSGHDISHLERTMRIALFLQEYEGGDRIVIGIAALLHDVHRIMQNETKKFVSPKDSLEIVRKILDVIDLTENQIDGILHAIEYHEVYNWNNLENKENDINTLILQDADNLEALGAIGIIRTFIYANSIKEPMFVENIPLEVENDFIEGDKSISTIHHFYQKLFRLANNMNTNKAKELAEKRTEFMKLFVNEFIEEWNGKL